MREPTGAYGGGSGGRWNERGGRANEGCVEGNVATRVGFWSIMERLVWLAPQSYRRWTVGSTELQGGQIGDCGLPTSLSAIIEIGAVSIAKFGKKKVVSCF